MANKAVPRQPKVDEADGVAGKAVLDKVTAGK